ncbi:UNVERIFIED_CONTAM: hypothetical protein Sradi_7039600 [Sesamum radiatum]|uniref:DUF4283 domain-containing protein n=1 Tax=Sesamum radiatum TaxID=300843 RepID=A0AAW2J8G9_SESRA
MEENSLLPLSHTTRTSHSHNTHLSLTHSTPHTGTLDSSLADDGASDGSEEGIDTTGSTVDRLKKEFNMAEFFSLAHRVLDDGDKASMDALHALNARWESKIGPIQGPPMRTVAPPRSTIDENPLVRSFRMARRNLSRRVEEAPPPLMIEPAPWLIAYPSCLPCGAPSPSVAAPSAAHPPTSDTPPIYIGNVPLRPPKLVTPPKTKFAEVFNNSTRRTLWFIPPECQKGEVVVRPTIDMVHAGSRKLGNTAVGYFLGRKPPFHQVQNYFCSIWNSVRDVIATTNGFFFIMFETAASMDEVIDGGPWLFNGQPLVLQHWEPGMALCKHSHTQVLVWIKLHHLPVEYWTVDGLSAVASGIGKPLYPDAITKACTRLDFARVCVMLDYHSTLLKHIVVMSPSEDSLEIPCRVDVEYEWIPSKCTQCCSLGNSTAPVVVPPMPTREDEIEEVSEPTRAMEAEALSPTTTKGKAIIVYNPFSALSNVDDEDVSFTGGPNVVDKVVKPTKLTHGKSSYGSLRGLVGMTGTSWLRQYRISPRT